MEVDEAGPPSPRPPSPLPFLPSWDRMTFRLRLAEYHVVQEVTIIEIDVNHFCLLAHLLSLMK